MQHMSNIGRNVNVLQVAIALSSSDPFWFEVSFTTSYYTTRVGKCSCVGSGQNADDVIDDYVEGGCNCWLLKIAPVNSPMTSSSQWKLLKEISS